jgi:hypothetical protein
MIAGKGLEKKMFKTIGLKVLRNWPSATNSFWETDSHSATQQCTFFLWNKNIGYRVHKKAAIYLCPDLIESGPQSLFLFLYDPF